MRKIRLLLLVLASLFLLSACGDGEEEITTEPIFTEPTETEPVETVPTTPVLVVPQNVSIQGDFLSWDAVIPTTHYLIQIGEKSVTVTGTSYDLSLEDLIPGEYIVTVSAVDGLNSSLPSAEILYTVVPLINPNDLLALILPLMNTSYDVGMVESDFNDEFEYQYYLDSVKMATRYAEVSSQMGMNELEASGLFEDVMLLSKNMDDIISFSAFMGEMEILDTYNLTPEIMANMLYEFVTFSFEEQIAVLNIQIEYIETDESTFADQSYVMETTEYINLYNTLKSYATIDQIDALDALFLKTENPNTDLIIGYMLYAIHEYLNYGTFEQDPFEYYEDLTLVSYAHDVADIVGAIYENNDISLLQDLMFGDLEILYELYDEYYWYTNGPSFLEYYQSKLEQLERVHILFINEKEQMIDALIIVIDYIVTLQNTLSLNVISLIDDMMYAESLTRAEVIMIKDEVVGILHQNLPSSADFALLYEMLYYVITSFNDTDFDQLLTEMSFFGETTYASLDLFFSLLENVTINTLDEFQALLDELYITEYMPEWDEYIIVDVNPEQAVDMVLYVLNFIDTFITLNPEKVAALDQLMTSDSVEALYNIGIDYLIADLDHETYMDSEEKARLTAMLTDLKGEYQTILAALEVLDRVGIATIDKLMSTEGSLITHIIHLANLQNEEYTTEELITIINELVDEIISLNDVLTVELDETSIKALLDLAKLPIEFILSEQMPTADLDGIYEDIRSYLVELILNALTLEKTIVDSLYTFDFTTLTASNEFTLYEELFDTLAIVLDETTETLITDSIRILFDDILGQEDILELLHDTTGTRETLRDSIIDNVEFFISEIHEISTWDLFNMTQEQEERYAVIIDLFLSFYNWGQDPYPYDPFGNASPLYLHEEIISSIPEEGYAYFVFIPEETTTYVIQSFIYANDAYLTLGIFDEDGYPLHIVDYMSNNKLSWASYVIELEADALYYIGIDAYEMAYALYNLNIYLYTDDQLPYDDAITIYAEDITMAYTSIFEEVLYEFTPETTGYYTIKSLLDDYLTDPYMMLFSNGLYLGLYDDEGDYMNFDTQDTYFEEGLTYYIYLSVYNEYPSEVPFVITATDIESPFETAIPVTANQLVTVTTHTDGYSFYVFVPEVTAYYDIYSVVPDDSIDPFGYIMNIDFDTLAFNDDSDDFLNFSLDKVYLISGETYYIVVGNYSEPFLDFSFFISEPDLTYVDPTASNISFETAITVLPNLLVEVTFYGDESLYFVFEPTVSGNYTIYSITGEEFADPLLILYSGTEDWLALSDDDGGNLEFSLTYYFESGETYYLEIVSLTSDSTSFEFIISSSSN